MQLLTTSTRTKGLAEAQYLFGCAGGGGEWLKKAGEQGHLAAMLILAESLPEDEGAMWLKRAAGTGAPEAVNITLSPKARWALPGGGTCVCC